MAILSKLLSVPGSLPSARLPRKPVRVGGRVLLVVALVLMPVLGTAGFHRLCAEPLDVSGNPSFWLPEPLRAIKQSDAVAYPSHVLVGTLIGQANCNPTAVAVQWTKAAWHARSADELQHAVGWIEESAARSPGQQLSARMCPRAYRPSDPHAVQQLEALRAAGLPCRPEAVS